jgi:hypothetical protein
VKKKLKSFLLLDTERPAFCGPFLCPWMDGMTQGAMDGGAAMPWMDGMTQGAMDGGASMFVDELCDVRGS